MNNAIIMTPDMAKKICGMLATVPIQAGQAQEALILLSAVQAIASGDAVVSPKPETSSSN